MIFHHAVCMRDGRLSHDEAVITVRGVEEIAHAPFNKVLENDITMCHPTSGIRGDQENGIYVCETCQGESCGCCIGLCEGCVDIACAECGDPGARFDPGCPTGAVSLTRGDA
jgi:hypothetical protein